MKKKVTINLYTSEILHDIENVAFLEGKASRTGDNDGAVSLMQASEDPEDSDKIMRSVGTAYGNLFATMSDYISDDSKSASNIMMDRTTDMTINLLMPSNFRESVVDTIASASHDYIVALALAEWFAITNKADSESYAAKAAASLALVASSLEQRERPTRIEPGITSVFVYIGKLPSDIITPNEGELKRYTEMREVENKQLITSIGILKNEKICYAYPYDLGELESIKDDSGFEYKYSFDHSVITMSDGSQYYCYVLSEPITKDQRTTLQFR